MIAVTVATDNFMDLANEQASWMRRHSGLQTFVISTKDGYAEKLELHRHFPGKKVLFFDADYRLIRPVNIAEIYKEGSFTGVMDPGILDKGMFTHNDCKALRMNREKYMNTGFWIADFSSQNQVKAFNAARQMLAEKRNGAMWKEVGDHGEQSFLNLSLQRSCGHGEVRLVGLRWNFYMLSYTWGCVPTVPRGIIGVHAAGIHISEKSKHLDSMQSLFSSGYRPNVRGAEKLFKGL